MGISLRAVFTPQWITVAVVATLTAYGATIACAQNGLQRANGYVAAISDGDTFYIELDGKRTRVRIAQIDAPESGQAFGRRSEQSLRELIWKQTVTVTWNSIDRYGRPVVSVSYNGVDIGAEQVRRGMAWVYRQYARDPSLLVFEQEAKSARRGLWADPTPIPPWQYRKEAARAQ